jgi:putative flippase GtrA
VHKIARFASTGLASTFTHVAVSASLIEFAALHPSIANGSAFVVASCVSYALNTRWTFEAPASRANAIRFATVALTCMFVGMAIAAAVEAAGLHYAVGIGCIVLVVPAISYLMHDRWTYGRSIRPDVI